MTKKTETQFALLAAAFAADEQMARQVCSLLANGHIAESEAQMMLGLVRDGHLATQTRSYPWYVYNNPPYTFTTNPRPVYPSCGTTTIAGPSFNSTTSLTAMCSAALEAA